MASTKFAKSVGYILTKKYCVYDEVNVLSLHKKIDYVPVFDVYDEVFRIYLFSLEDAMKIIDFIKSRNFTAVFVNFD